MERQIKILRKVHQTEANVPHLPADMMVSDSPITEEQPKKKTKRSRLSRGGNWDGFVEMDVETNKQQSAEKLEEEDEEEVENDNIYMPFEKEGDAEKILTQYEARIERWEAEEKEKRLRREREEKERRERRERDEQRDPEETESDAEESNAEEQREAVWNEDEMEAEIWEKVMSFGGKKPK